MSDTAPRRQVAQFGVPVNYETGQPLTERQQKHLAALWSAGEMLYAAMHDAEGSGQPGEHQEHDYMTRRMGVAALHLETALMYARKAALEAP